MICEDFQNEATFYAAGNDDQKKSMSFANAIRKYVLNSVLNLRWVDEDANGYKGDVVRRVVGNNLSSKSKCKLMNVGKTALAYMHDIEDARATAAEQIAYWIDQYLNRVSDEDPDKFQLIHGNRKLQFPILIKFSD
jgi:hypothetical protein